MAIDLQRVSATHDLPFRRICLIRIEGSQTHGTGWFLGPSLVITANHVVGGVAASSVLVTPGSSGRHDTTFGIWRAISVLPATNGQDFAGLVLPQPVGRSTGTFGIAAIDAVQVHAPAVISGYSSINDTQFTGAGGILTVLDSVFRYDIVTQEGQSGAPIWIGGANDLVAGIHVGTGEALVITDDVFSEVMGWHDSTQG